MVALGASFLLQVGDVIPRGTRAEVFDQIYTVFLWLGTLVGVVVITYMLYKAYKYRAGGAGEDADVERPSLGELPTGGGGGKKLFLSFGLSTIIVVSLIVWTYGTLLYVENAAASENQNEVEGLEVDVIGYQFGWRFVYPNGAVTNNVLYVPQGERVWMTVTSSDVFHNFGIPEQNAKADAIPGQTTDTWFQASEVGNYSAQCYELCGSGHSYMTADVVVMEPSAYEQWYENTNVSEDPVATPIRDN